MALIGWVLSMTNGLIFSRSPQQFKAHAHDPNYEKTTSRQALERDYIPTHCSSRYSLFVRLWVNRTIKRPLKVLKDSNKS